MLQPERVPGPSVKAVIITNSSSKDQDPGSEIKEVGKTRLQCKILERMIRLLGIPPHNIAVFDVSNSDEQQFWVATQACVAYPKYPQVFIGDERIGSLSDLEANPQRVSSLASKDMECTICLSSSDKGCACALSSAETPFQELGPIRKWFLAKDLSGLLASADEDITKK